MPDHARALACALLVAATVSGEPDATAEPLALEAIFAEEGHARTPSEISWSDDGQRLGFLWSERGDRDLWTMTPDRDREPLVLLRAGALRDGSREISYKGYRWAPDGEALLFETEGDLYLYRLADQALRRLTASDTGSEDPRFSPDGTRIAFVRAGDLWVLDLASGQERRLTHDGEEGRILNGKPDWVYWEEIWNRRSIGYWWSPDGRRIAYQRFDEEGVSTYPLLREQSPSATVEHQPYPKPGERNPRVTVGVLELESGVTTWMEAASEAGDDYLARVRFTPEGDRLGIIRLDRDQRAAELLLCDPATGECDPVLEERLDTWVDVTDEFELLRGGRVLWGSDRDGWRRLYLHGPSGEALASVMPEGLVMFDLERVVEETGEVFFAGFRAGGLGAKDRQLYRVPLEGGAATLLSAGGDGGMTAEVAPGGHAWVLTTSTIDSAPRATLHRAGGGDAVELPFAAATAYDRAALPRWEFLTVPGPDGFALPARVLKPPDFDPSRHYPVIMFHYGGPLSQVVEDSSVERPLLHLWHVRMAQRGYVVVAADNLASAFFGKKGADKLHRRFGEVELRSQLAVVDWLKAQPWVDPARIGLWGWSGGGANTLYSVLSSPGTWRAAVAGAPVTDWRLYDSIWAERYLDSPADNPDGYRDSSAVHMAARLRDHLLLVHGTADDNVHLQNTIVLSRELIRAGIPFEQMIYPDEKHGLSDTANRDFCGRMERFFDRWLRDQG